MFIVLLFCIPLGYTTIISVHIGNNVGCGDMLNVKYICYIGISSILIIQTCIAICVLTFGPYYVLLYTSNPDIINIVTYNIQYIACFVLFDGLQCILSGILRGLGKQHIGAWVNFICFYIIGIPVCYILCFHLEYHINGLVIGMLFANMLQVLFYVMIMILYYHTLFQTSTANWLQYQIIH